MERWQQAGVFDQLHHVLLAKLNAASCRDWSKACVDGSHIRAKRRGRHRSVAGRPASSRPRRTMLPEREAGMRPGRLPCPPPSRLSPPHHPRQGRPRLPHRPASTRPRQWGKPERISQAPPIYMALAVTAEPHRDLLGLWVGGEGGEGTKHWLRVLTKLKNRGVEDILMLVCDGLKSLPDAVGAVWPKAVVQTCVIHLLRASFHSAGRQDWDKAAEELKPACIAPTKDAASSRFLEAFEEGGRKYPAIVRSWENAWAEFVPFPHFDAEVRRIVCTTNAIESVNARLRRKPHQQPTLSSETNLVTPKTLQTRATGTYRMISTVTALPCSVSAVQNAHEIAVRWCQRSAASSLTW